jgi:hypothetical protein
MGTRIDPAATIADAAREIHERGFTILPGLLDPDRVATARRALDEVFAAEADIAAERRWLTDAYRVGYMLPAKHRDFATMWDRDAAVGLARAVLGEDAVLAAFNGMAMLPRGAGQSLHRDHPVPTPGVTLCINIVCALDPFTPANGATRLVPGSHRSISPGSTTITSEQRRDLERRALTPELAPGCAVAFDATLWHAAGRNTTAGHRRALHMFFARPWMRPHWDFPGSLPAETAARLTDEQRRRLGYGDGPRRYDAAARRVVRGNP